MNIVFFGSDDFAAVHLEGLLKSDHRVLACVTPPDRPQGRGMKLTPTPIKGLSLKNNIEGFQPENLSDKNFQQELRSLNADLFVVIAYGKLLPIEVLDMPQKYAINVHSSLLPQYRGAAPINWAIINGDKKTGISIIKMSERMDAGDIVAQKEIDIDNDDTSYSLRERMKKVGPEFLIQTIDAVGNGRDRSLRPQDPKGVTFAPKLEKGLGEIDWKKSADEIRNLIRGLQPWPTAFTFYKGKMLKILSAEKVPLKQRSKPGCLDEVTKDHFSVATAKDALKIMRVHLEASKAMSSREFLVGHSFKIGDKL